MIDITHIAGGVIEVDDRVRQRCAWCGAILIDENMANVMVPTDQPDKSFPTWPVGDLVTLRGNSSWTSHVAVGEPLPPSMCALLDPSVTGL